MRANPLPLSPSLGVMTPSLLHKRTFFTGTNKKGQSNFYFLPPSTIWLSRVNRSSQRGQWCYTEIGSLESTLVVAYCELVTCAEKQDRTTWMCCGRETTFAVTGNGIILSASTQPYPHNFARSCCFVSQSSWQPTPPPSRKWGSSRQNCRFSDSCSHFTTIGFSIVATNERRRRNPKNGLVQFGSCLSL